MPIAITFFTVALAAHIASIMIALGVTFAYPVMYVIGTKRARRSMTAAAATDTLV
jgi:hypothetical protein